MSAAAFTRGREAEQILEIAVAAQVNRLMGEGAN